MMLFVWLSVAIFAQLGRCGDDGDDIWSGGGQRMSKVIGRGSGDIFGWGNQKTLVNKQLRNDFQEYDRCVRHQEKQYDGQLTAHTIIARAGSNINLKCFDCLHPEDLFELESIWKPSAGYIGRKLSKLKDWFKVAILSEESEAEIFEAQWKYDWEFSMIGLKNWKKISQFEEKGGIVIKAKIALKKFLQKEKYRHDTLDRFELRIKNVSFADSGFYRCIRGGSFIGRLYFVDIQNSPKEEFINTLSTDPPRTNEQMESTFGDVKTVAKPSEWTDCNKCGNVTGEKARTIECHLQPSVSLDSLQPPFEFLRLFGSVPCRSSLVPLDVRKKLGHLEVIHETQLCKIPCKHPEHMERLLRVRDEFGKWRITDVLQYGEFIFGEILPRLASPVVRRSFEVHEGDPLVLSCRFDSDMTKAIFWYSKRLGALSSWVLQTGTKVEKGHMDLDGRLDLIFKEVFLSDEDEYHCYDGDASLIGVFYISIKKSDQTQEFISNLQMFTKFAVFLFIFIIVVNLVTK